MDYKELLKKYKLSSDERAYREALISNVIQKINGIIEDMNLEASPVLVGSSARGTSLKNSDIDIFIRFSTEYDKKQLERYGLDIGFKVISDGVAKYAEHPYVSGFVDNIKIDIVPCYRMKMGERTKSSVDRTPLHTEFLNSVMNDEERDQAIILKLFLKRIGVYGSELRTEGFSGYVSELCIHYFNTFENFLRFVCNSRGQLVIGPKLSEFNSPVILMDPVDSNRNAASAVSKKSLSILRIASSLYLKTPDPGLIDPENIYIVDREIHDRKTYLIMLELKKPNIIDDILYPQIELMKRNLNNFAEREDFTVMNTFSSVNEKTIQVLLELQTGSLPAVKIHEGPPADNPNALRFYEKYRTNSKVSRGPYVKDDRIYVELKRDETDFRIILKSELKNINFGHNLNLLKETSRTYTSKKKIMSSAVYRNFMSVCEPPDLSTRKNLEKQ
jgi:tRNA nucleotidyltransferase (CCA-adding enzyme)